YAISNTLKGFLDGVSSPLGNLLDLILDNLPDIVPDILHLLLGRLRPLGSTLVKASHSLITKVVEDTGRRLDTKGLLRWVDYRIIDEPLNSRSNPWSAFKKRVDEAGNNIAT